MGTTGIRRTVNKVVGMFAAVAGRLSGCPGHVDKSETGTESELEVLRAENKELRSALNCETEMISEVFDEWKKRTTAVLKEYGTGTEVRAVIAYWRQKCYCLHYELNELTDRYREMESRNIGGTGQ